MLRLLRNFKRQKISISRWCDYEVGDAPLVKNKGKSLNPSHNGIFITFKLQVIAKMM
jgi:hypothetical protein